mgnify:FL=1
MRSTKLYYYKQDLALVVDTWLPSLCDIYYNSTGTCKLQLYSTKELEISRFVDSIAYSGSCHGDPEVRLIRQHRIFIQRQRCDTASDLDNTARARWSASALAS